MFSPILSLLLSQSGFKGFERAFVETSVAPLSSIERTTTFQTDPNADLIMVGYHFYCRMGPLADLFALGDPEIIYPLVRVNGFSLITPYYKTNTGVNYPNPPLVHFAFTHNIVPDPSTPGNYFQVMYGFVPILRMVHGGLCEFGFGKILAGIIGNWQTFGTLFMVSLKGH